MRNCVNLRFLRRPLLLTRNYRGAFKNVIITTLYLRILFPFTFLIQAFSSFSFSTYSLSKIIPMTGKDHLGGVKVASAKESPFQELPHFPDTTTQRHRELLEPSQDTVSSSSDSVWQRTVEQCAKSIVSIKGIRNRCFDTDTPSNFAATGFVVDAERGIILTNRHVVSGGPTTAQAVLSNHEQIDLVPIYRDPVHDFGFFKYGTENVRFLDIPGIELYPDGARVGMEIRVIGYAAINGCCKMCVFTSIPLVLFLCDSFWLFFSLETTITSG